MKLDLRDKRILDLLIRNCRYSAADIGRAVGLSKDAISYRINRLMKEGAILKFETAVNHFALGYRLFYMLLQMQTLTSAKEQAVVKALKANPFVLTFLKASGRWDWQITLVAKDDQHCDTIREELFKKMHGNIKDYEIYSFLTEYKWTPYYKDVNLKTKIWPHRDSAFTSELAWTEYEVRPSSKADLDATDFKILQALASDARTELTAVAKKVGMTGEAVKYRIRNLIKNGIILGFTILPDYLALGLQMHTVFLQLRDTSDEAKLTKFFKSRDYIIDAIKMSGRWNVWLYVLAKDFNGFHVALSDLRNGLADNLVSYDSTLILEWPYYTLLPRGIVHA